MAMWNSLRRTGRVIVVVAGMGALAACVPVDPGYDGYASSPGYGYSYGPEVTVFGGGGYYGGPDYRYRDYRHRGWRGRDWHGHGWRGHDWSNRGHDWRGHGGGQWRGHGGGGQPHRVVPDRRPDRGQWHNRGGGSQPGYWRRSGRGDRGFGGPTNPGIN